MWATIGTWFRQYADRALRFGNDLWICSYPLLGVALLNVIYFLPFTSQAPELASTINHHQQNLAQFANSHDPDVPRTFFWTLIAIIYATAAIAVSGFLALWQDAAKPNLLSSAVPYYLAFAALVSALDVLAGPTGAGIVGFIFLAALVALPAISPYLDPIVKQAKFNETIHAWLIAVLLASGAAVFTATLLWPVSFPRFLTTLPLIYFAVGFWSLVGTLIFIALPRSWNYPSFWLVPILWALLISPYNDNHQIRINPPAVAPLKVVTFQSALDEWMHNHCKSHGACPLTIVAAEGGGLRAAYWTAMSLTFLDRATRNHFGDHVFAVSSVSGGSFGVATYFASRGVCDADQRLQHVLSEDYLAPVIGSLVFGNAFQWLWPVPIPKLDRAWPFEDAIGDSWKADMSTNAAHDNDDRFDEGFPPRLLSKVPGPEFYFNATNVESGRRFILSRAMIPSPELVHKRAPQPKPPTQSELAFDAQYAFDSNAAYKITSMWTKTAIHLGARFTYVSPAGSLYTADTPPRYWGRIVDGGYYDNTGLTTALDIADAICSLRNCRRDVAIRIVYLSNGPKTSAYPTNPSRSAGLHDVKPSPAPTPHIPIASELISPLEAAANTAGAAQFDAQRMRIIASGNYSVAVVSFANLGEAARENTPASMTDGLGLNWNPALGWWLAPSSRETMDCALNQLNTLTPAEKKAIVGNLDWHSHKVECPTP